MTQWGAGTVIHFGDGHSLTLTGVVAESLVAGDFVFTPATNHAPVGNDDTLALSAPAGDGWSFNPDNGHYYRLVTTTMSWGDASAQAQADGGYLATIASATENAFVTEYIIGGSNAWLGGSDAAVEGEWRWVAGPEAGQQFWSVPGGASAWNHGVPVGVYANWDSRG